MIAPAPLPLIVDTDVGTDVDDALALAFAARHPGIALRAVTTVSGDTVRRGRIAAAVLAAAGRADVEVAAGIGGPARAEGRRVEFGHEGVGLPPGAEHVALSARDGVRLLVEEAAAAAASSRPLHLAVIGMQTNLAAALDQDQHLGDGLTRVAVMGGVFAPVRHLDVVLPAAADHNLSCDPAGAVRALNAGLPLLYVPLDVTTSTWLTTAVVDRLRRGDELGRLLAGLVDVWAPVFRGFERGDPPADHVALLHDPLTVACVVERSFVTVETLPVSVAVLDGHVRTFVDPMEGHPAEVVTACDVPAFVDFWLDTVLS